MAFSYQYGANPAVDYPRFLISDTVETDASGNRVYAFEDEEIAAATLIEQSVWQSAMRYSPPAGVSVGTSPVSWRRVAATLLDALSANHARLTIISKLLDVTMNPNAAKEMRAQAASLREIDDNSGSFMIIEQVTDAFSFRDRFWKQVQRQTAGLQ